MHAVQTNSDLNQVYSIRYKTIMIIDFHRIEYLNTQPYLRNANIVFVLIQKTVYHEITFYNIYFKN